MRDIKVTFIYGGTRLGKTTYVYDKHQITDVCRINNYIQGTFETYNGQRVLVLDEFTGKLDITFVNNLLDKFPLDLPARFSNRTACFTDVFVISNLALSDLYKEEQQFKPEVYKAFIQRFHNVIRFTALGKWHYELKDGQPIKPLQIKQLATDLKSIQNDDLPF